MSGSPKPHPREIELDPYPLVGPAVPKTSLLSRSDLSDWVDLMKVVEILCPIRTEHEPHEERGSDARSDVELQMIKHKYAGVAMMSATNNVAPSSHVHDNYSLQDNAKSSGCDREPILGKPIWAISSEWATQNARTKTA